MIAQHKAEDAPIINDVTNDRLKAKPCTTIRESFESMVEREMNLALDRRSGEYAQEHLKEDNNVKQLVVASSKGSFINISPMSVCVSQQLVEGCRIPFGIDDSSLELQVKLDEVINQLAEDCRTLHEFTFPYSSTSTPAHYLPVNLYRIVQNALGIITVLMSLTLPAVSSRTPDEEINQLAEDRCTLCEFIFPRSSTSTPHYLSVNLYRIVLNALGIITVSMSLTLPAVSSHTLGSMIAPWNFRRSWTSNSTSWLKTAALSTNLSSLVLLPLHRRTTFPSTYTVSSKMLWASLPCQCH